MYRRDGKIVVFLGRRGVRDLHVGRFKKLAFNDSYSSRACVYRLLCTVPK